MVSISEIINNVSLSLKYRYPRLRQRNRQFQVGNATFCEVVNHIGEFINTKRALDNIDSSSWNVDQDSIGVNPMPPTNWYNCPPTSGFIWYNINDPQEWVLSVFYTASYRFAQTIIEDYTIDIKAPKSIDQYGEKNAVMTHSIDIDYDVSEWEKNDIYKTTDGLIEDANDYYIDQDGDDYESAIKTAINMAKTSILRSHRKNTVTFESFLFPTLDLKHTLKVDTDKVVAKGKVTSIEHLISVNKRFGSSTVEISFSTSQDSQTDDEVTAPTRATVDIVGEIYQEPVILESTEVDIVTPAIDDLSRNTQTGTATATYNVEIPNKTFTVTF